MTTDELNFFCDQIRNLPCPVCSNAAIKLNATIYGTVMSVGVLTFTNKDILIACPLCLDVTNQDASKRTKLLGWWALPWGVIRTIQIIKMNKRAQKQHNILQANYALNSFVLNNETIFNNAKDDKHRMMEIIRTKRIASSEILSTWYWYWKQKK